MRKSFPKIIIAFFLTVFILQIIALFFLLAAPVASQAIEFKPQVGIPGSEFDTGKPPYNFSKNASTKPIAEYIRAIYNYAIGIIGILAAVVLMVGGVLWIVAGGNATQIGEAKAYIGAALTGLVLALTSYLILSTVNPALVNLQITKIPGVKEAPIVTSPGCCVQKISPDVNYYSENITGDKCKEKGGDWQPNKSCPTPCCLYNLSSSTARWTECISKMNLLKTTCEAMSATRVVYMENGNCKKTEEGSGNNRGYNNTCVPN